MVDADDSDDLTIVFHGHGHFRGGGGADTHVTQVTGDIGHELGAGVKSGPAGHTLAHAQGDFAVVGRQADLSFNLEPAGVGIEQEIVPAEALKWVMSSPRMRGSTTLGSSL